MSDRLPIKIDTTSNRVPAFEASIALTGGAPI